MVEYFIYSLVCANILIYIVKNKNMINHLDTKYAEIITFSDFFLGSLRFIKGFIGEFFIYKKAYKNYLEIIFNILNKKSKITCILRNETSFNLSSFQLINFVAESFNNSNFYFNFEDDLVKFKMFDENSLKIRDIIIHGGITNGDINGMFISQEYQLTPVKNRIVLDVGANIADSSVYFAMMGANKVIGVEPFSRNFYLAKKNIVENNLTGKIIIEQAICSDTNGIVEIDPNTFSTASSSFVSKKGITIHSFTLKKMISKYDLPSSSILKLDCEGDEYKIVLSSSKDTLRTFDFIILEYHYGYKNLKKYLETCGFEVNVTLPIVTGQLPWVLKYFKIFNHSQKNIKLGATGLLYAKRITV